MTTKQAQGSVFYNKDRKNWIASYVVQNLTTGKPKRIRKSFATEKLAKEFLKDINLQKNSAIFIQNNGIPLIKLIKMLLQKKVDSNLITDRAYARTMDTIRTIEKSYLADKNINEITTDELQAYFNSLTEIYSNSSIQKNYFQFKSAFEYALNKGYIHENPMYETIKPKSKKEDKICSALEVEEQQRLTDYLLNVDTKSVPYRNVFLIQLYMGLRVGETLALQTSDFDFSKKILRISRTLTTDKNDKVCIGKTTKTYAGKRDLPIPDFILPYILEQLEISKDNKDNMLFLTPNKKLVLHSTINNQLKSIAKKVNITHPISTHTLRHTYGTRCIESGMRAVALQRLLGHTDINVTLNTYTSVLNKYKEKEMEKLNDYYLSNDIFNKSRELSTINYKLLDDNNDLTR